MRDRNLDIYRGAIMIYITCFVIWYGGKVSRSAYLKSWITGIFFAMATVFYIVGASFSLSLEKPFRTYLKGRIKRVAIPYWKYALVCFSGCCVSLLEVGRDNTVEWLYILCVLYPYGRISIILIIFGLFRLTWSYLFVFPFYAGWFAGVIYLLSFSVSFWYCCYCSKLIIQSCFKL